MIARRIVVAGRVQGVFFRDTTRRLAQSRGVTGWVRNRDDGTVEAQLQGDAESVDSVIDWARSGPSRADVTGVDIREVDAEGLSDFEIR